MAVLVFNEGHGLSISAICKSVGIQFSQNMLDQLNEIDSTRLYEKHHQSTEICKQRRKYVKLEMVKSNDAFTHDEMRKVHPINPKNSIKVQINTTAET